MVFRAEYALQSVVFISYGPRNPQSLCDLDLKPTRISLNGFKPTSIRSSILTIRSLCWHWPRFVAVFADCYRAANGDPGRAIRRTHLKRAFNESDESVE